MSKINELQNVKNNIKSALKNKGCVVDVGMIGYADKIRGIKTAANVESVVDFKPWLTFEGSTTSDVSLYEMFNKIYYDRPYGGKYDFSYMFYNCKNLVNAPSQLETTKVKPRSCSWMFYGCEKLTTAPYINTSLCAHFERMFQGCKSLTTVPLYITTCRDANNVGTSFSNMFRDCTSLTVVPLFDMSNADTLNAMFYGCTSLTTVPLFDTSNVSIMTDMFRGCKSLTTIPQFDMSNTYDVDYMFYNCESLTSLPLLDCSRVWGMRGTFYECKSLTTLGGFANLGKADGFYKEGDVFLDLSYATNLTRESVLNVFRNLYDRKWMDSFKIKIPRYSVLYDSDIAIATNKGWTIVLT